MQWRKTAFAKFSFQEWLSSIRDEPINWIKSSGTDFLVFETHNLGWAFRTAQPPCKQQIMVISGSALCSLYEATRGCAFLKHSTQCSGILGKAGQLSECWSELSWRWESSDSWYSFSRSTSISQKSVVKLIHGLQATYHPLKPLILSMGTEH